MAMLECHYCYKPIIRSKQGRSSSGNRYCSIQCRNRGLARLAKPRIKRIPKQTPPGSDFQYVPLGHGQYAVVNTDDYPSIADRAWHLDARGYAVCSPEVRNGPKIRMHRLIMSSPKGLYVDHVDGDRLNNRRDNLRLASSAQNSRNSAKHRDNKSGYKGVSRKSGRRTRPWTVQICVDHRALTFGVYATPEEAAYVYDQVALQLFGKYARTNLI